MDTSLLQPYLGPISTVYDVDLVHSDSAIVRIRMEAKKQLDFEEGNREFPEGIFIRFYDENGKMTSTIRADVGYYDRSANLYRGVGDVQVENIEKEQRLNTEELFWDPTAKKIFTEKFVTIREGETFLQGTGMDAKDDFSEYTIYKISDGRTILPEDS